MVESTNGYLPIENYGIVGDLNTTALVGLNGSIDFFCCPSFDSPTIFGRLLDANKGGHFSISPDLNGKKHKQLYLPDTNVLVTRFLSQDGIVELTDCMPVSQQGPGKQIIRIVKAIKGEIKIRMECQPRYNYGRTAHTLQASEGGKRIEITPVDPVQPAMHLHSEVPMDIEGDAVRSCFTLKKGDTVHFLLVWAEAVEPTSTNYLDAQLEQTVDFWRSWVKACNYEGRWREEIVRSALVLKLLTCYNSGAIVAAATFGLPESIGGKRNWDYRYCWVRDSAFTVYALVKLGFHQEAIDYRHWVEARSKASKESGQLHTMYRTNGDTDIPEQTLDHWEGYKGSKPVRIGNAASTQHQADIYGELMDSLYLSNKYVMGISHDGWEAITRIIEFVRTSWREPDHGIWEIRGKPQHFLHSRLMCWVAIDRGMRLAVEQSLPAPLPDWNKTRADIYYSIFEDFWNEELHSFVQCKGGNTADASALMMPLVRFIAPTDPKWLSTLDFIGKTLGTDTLIQRYDAEKINFEGVGGSNEGSFTMCSFWYIECIARAGRIDEARLLFEKMLSYANHVGLYAEELGVDGAHLGNFPQAFTHLALISAAYALNLKLDKKSTKAWRF